MLGSAEQTAPAPHSGGWRASPGFFGGVQIWTQRLFWAGLPGSIGGRSGSAWQLHWAFEVESALWLSTAATLARSLHWSSLTQPSIGVVDSSCLRWSRTSLPAVVRPLASVPTV